MHALTWLCEHLDVLAPASLAGKLKTLAIKGEQPFVRSEATRLAQQIEEQQSRPKLKDGMRQIQRDGGFANMNSLLAVNAYASNELAASLGLNADYLYAQAVVKEINLSTWLMRLDGEDDPRLRVDVGTELIALLSGSD